MCVEDNARKYGEAEAPHRTQATASTILEIRKGDSLFILILPSKSGCSSPAVPKSRSRSTGAGLRYSGYRPSAKSDSTEKSKMFSSPAQFRSASRMKKQRGKVPSKLPAFPTALLISCFLPRRFKVVNLQCGSHRGQRQLKKHRSLLRFVKQFWVK